MACSFGFVWRSLLSLVLYGVVVVVLEGVLVVVVGCLVVLLLVLVGLNSVNRVLPHLDTFLLCLASIVVMGAGHANKHRCRVKLVEHLC